MKTRVFENPVKFAQSVKIKVDGEYVSLLELLQNADIELDETPTSGSDKAVSSGGVYSALQEKQGQISITKNDDGSVDINIPDAGEVDTSETLRVIDIKNLLNEPLCEITNGTAFLDLTKNGEYLIISSMSTSFEELGLDQVIIKFGFIKGYDNNALFTKPIINSSRVNEFLDGAGIDSTDGQVLYIFVKSLHRYPLFFKVTSNSVYSGQLWEF